MGILRNLFKRRLQPGDIIKSNAGIGVACRSWADRSSDIEPIAWACVVTGFDVGFIISTYPNVTMMSSGFEILVLVNGKLGWTFSELWTRVEN
jgi:energy-converting hydrogenase Eha subunit G